MVENEFESMFEGQVVAVSQCYDTSGKHPDLISTPKPMPAFAVNSNKEVK